MAVNDVLASGLLPVPPATLAAFVSYRAGGSSPAEAFEVWNFDATTKWYLDLQGFLSPRYNATSVKVRLPWMAATATTGGIRWNAGFRRLDTAEDVDGALTYSVQAATGAVPGTSGFPVYTDITFTTGAQIDSLVGGEAFVLRVSRDVSHAGDDMAGYLQLMASAVQILEA